MGEMRGVWPEEQPQDFDDVFREPQKRMTTEELVRWLRALPPEEWARLEATPRNVHGMNKADQGRMILAIEDAGDAVR